MLRTLLLLTLALLAHVTLVATLAHACGPHCGPQFSNNYNQHHKPQFQLGNRANVGNNGPNLIAKAPRPQATLASQPAIVKTLDQTKPVDQATDHPADLPANDPPLAAAR